MRRLLAVVLAGAVLVLAAPLPATPAQASAVSMRMVEQSISLEPGAPLQLVLRLGGTIAREAVFEVVAHQHLVTRAQLATAARGDVGRPVDRVRLPATEVGRTPEGFAELVVPTTTGALEVGVLRLADPGIHPLTVRLRLPELDEEGQPVGDGEVLASLSTFVHIEPEGGARGTLEVAYVARVTAAPTRRPDGGTTIEPAARRSLEQLVALLERTPLTFAVSLGPELLDGLRRSSDEDRALLERLERSLGDRELLVEPYVSMDPSGAARAGMIDAFTRQLRVGEDTMAEILPRQVTRRSVHMVEGAIDPGGASLLRDLGMRSIVLLPDALAHLDATELDELDPTLLVQLGIGVDATIPASVVDRSLAEALARAAEDPVTAAHLIVMDLLALRAESVSLLGGLGDPAAAAAALAGRSVTLATPSGSVGDVEVVSRVLGLAASTPGLAVTTASIAAAITDTAIVDGLLRTLTLPPSAGPDLDDLADRMFSLGLDAATIGSMLPPGDPRPEMWEQQMLLMPATELSAAELDAFEATVRRDLDALRSSVETPSVADVTLGGRRSTIRLKLRNDADVPLTVAVRMESSKLSFPRGQEVVTLPPDDVTEVEIPVEARSNGTSPVSVSLLTPFGDVPLQPPVEFAARVNALSGMGQVVTVAGGLILASWWVQHLRSRRRERLARPAGAAPGQ